MRVGIIGGGASGILSAILIKKNNPSIDVTILEQNDRVCKKLLQTGNGMCNLDNVNSNDYRNYNTDLIGDLIKKYDYQYVTKVFKDLGLITLVDSEGRVYPYSRRASNVLDILLINLNINKVNVRTGYVVNSINRVKNQFVINDEFIFDSVILSCGGQSSISGDYKLPRFIQSLGLSWVDTQPSLSALKTKESVKALSGIKIKCKVQYYVGNKVENMVTAKYTKWNLIDERSGELLFKDDGVSGIVIFELSRLFDKTKHNKIVIDMFSDYKEEELTNIIQSNYHKFVSLNDALIGLVPKMIAIDIIKKSNNDIRKMSHLLKNYEYQIVGTYDFNQSQVMRGGVDLNCLKLDCFESKKVPNLYVIGEGVDVDGTCGGFNLHFAWVSAIAATKSILTKCK